MSASILFEQGMISEQGSLDTGVISTVVDVSNFSNTGVNAWRWVMLDKPEGSAATLASPTASATQFTPDIPGTYLIQLRTYADSAAQTIDASDTQAFGVRYTGALPWRLPAAGEGLQYGSRGWAAEVNAILAAARAALIAGGLPGDFPYRPVASDFGTPVITGTIANLAVADAPGAALGGVHDYIQISATDPQAGAVAIIPIAMPSAPLPDRFEIDLVFFTGAPPSGDFAVQLAFGDSTGDLYWSIYHAVDVAATTRPAFTIVEVESFVPGASWDMPDLLLSNAVFIRASFEKVAPFTAVPQIRIEAEARGFSVDQDSVKGLASSFAPSSGSISAGWLGEDFETVSLVLSYTNTLVGVQDVFLALEFLPHVKDR